MTQIVKIMLLTTFVILLATGCGGFQRDKIVRNPKSSALISDVRGGRLEIMVFHPSEQQWYVWGWVEAEDFIGWTLSQYDWPVEVPPRGEAPDVDHTR